MVHSESFIRLKISRSLILLLTVWLDVLEKLVIVMDKVESSRSCSEEGSKGNSLEGVDLRGGIVRLEGGCSKEEVGTCFRRDKKSLDRSSKGS